MLCILHNLVLENVLKRTAGNITDFCLHSRNEDDFGPWNPCRVLSLDLSIRHWDLVIVWMHDWQYRDNLNVGGSNYATEEMHSALYSLWNRKYYGISGLTGSVCHYCISPMNISIVAPVTTFVIFVEHLALLYTLTLWSIFPTIV